MGLFVPCIPLLMLVAAAAAQPAVDSELKRILDFMSVENGRWSNKAQLEAGSNHHDLIEFYVRPVEVPALGNKPSLYVEQSINNTLVTLNVIVVTVDNDDKNVIRTLPYEFVDPRNYKPNEFNIEDLQNLTRDQLKHDPDCVDRLVRVSEGVYSGICMQCRSMIDEIKIGYATTMTCDQSTGTALLPVPAEPSVVPYKFDLTSPKFPLINPPENYISPCDKQLGSSSNTTAY